MALKCFAPAAVHSESSLFFSEDAENRCLFVIKKILHCAPSVSPNKQGELMFVALAANDEVDASTVHHSWTVVLGGQFWGNKWMLAACRNCLPSPIGDPVFVEKMNALILERSGTEDILHCWASPSQLTCPKSQSILEREPSEEFAFWRCPNPLISYVGLFIFLRVLQRKTKVVKLEST